MLFIVFLDSKTVKTYKNLGFVANYIQKPIKTNGFLQFLTLGVWFVVPASIFTVLWAHCFKKSMKTNGFFQFWTLGVWFVGPTKPPWMAARSNLIENQWNSIKNQ